MVAEKECFQEIVDKCRIPFNALLDSVQEVVTAKQYMKIVEKYNELLKERLDRYDK